jgi:hypothetical protein
MLEINFIIVPTNRLKIEIHKYTRSNLKSLGQKGLP